MTGLYEKIEEAAAFVRDRFPEVPKAGLILGTGLGELARNLASPVAIDYADIPHFARSTTESHAGRLVAGWLEGVPVVAFEGRFHLYEGYTPEQVTFPVRVAKALGAAGLVVTCACGGMNPHYEKGDLIILEDHINALGVNPLVGPNDERLGIRFPDMCYPYDREYLRLAEAIALREGVRAHRGVYAAMLGPCLETRAEYRMLRLAGADAVGMSTVPEAIVAVHAGLRTLAVGVMTDVCLADALEPCKIEDIIAVANEATPKMERLVQRFVAEAPWEPLLPTA